jgi:hypothetical protein
LGATLFVVALVGAVATFATVLFRSTVAFELWLDATPGRAISDRDPYVESEPPPALAQNVDTRAA